MADLEAAGQHLSFDDILDAVQESKRGRWFLAQYAERLRQQEGAALLAAINRLESRMGQLAPQAAASPSAVAAVQGALQKARQDLVKLGLAPNHQSEEARLFAKIAENARKSMPLAVDSNAQIVRTLELVSEIDQVMTAGGPARGAEFFSEDAQLFERPATAKPVLVAKPEPEAAPPAAVAAPAKEAGSADIKTNQGAKLVIRRSSQSAPADVPDFVAKPCGEPMSVQPPAAPQPVAPQPAPLALDAQHVDTPRIVIIRRKAEDMPEMIMPDPAQPDGGQAAAEAPAPAMATVVEEANSAA